MCTRGMSRGSGTQAHVYSGSQAQLPDTKTVFLVVTTTHVVTEPQPMYGGGACSSERRFLLHLPVWPASLSHCALFAQSSSSPSSSRSSSA